jgi:hypothetical protein
MADVAQHLPRRRADVDLAGRGADHLHQRRGVGLGALGGGESRQGVGQDLAARPVQLVEGAGADDQGVGGIEAAGDADHQRLGAGGLQPRGEALDLDVVGLVAVLREPRRVGRHVGEALDLALQLDRLREGVERHRHDTERPVGPQLGGGVVGEAVHPHPLGAQAAHVDVGQRQLIGDETLGRGQRHPVLEHLGLAVPGEVGGGFA